MATTPNGSVRGGYDYQFVNTPTEMLVCKICHYPSREPYLSGCCGHIFCSSCLEGAKRTPSNVPDVCPICRSEEFNTFPNKQIEREVRNLHVFCTNKDKGCGWKGTINDIINHLNNDDGCQYEKMTCSNDCGKCLQRQYLTSHLEAECVRREVGCQHCHLTGEHKFIEGEHKEHCSKYPIACPNNCEADTIPREDIDKHRKMCPLEKLNCPNDCGISLQQQYMSSHVETECSRRKVDCQYCHEKGEHQFIESEHKEGCPKFPIACPNKCEAGVIPRDDVEEHKKMCPLEIIQCEYHMVGCEERMAHKDQKNHNREKMENHLSFTTSRFISTQSTVQSMRTCFQDLSSSYKDLTSRHENLTSAQLGTVNTVAKLIDRVHQAEGNLTITDGLTLQIEKYKNDITLKVEQVEEESKKQLAITKDGLTLKLQQNEDDFKQELTVAKDTLKSIQEEAKNMKDDFTKQLENLETTHKDAISVINNELIATQEKAKKREGELTEELGQARKDTTSAIQELADTKKGLIATQEEVKKLEKLLTASNKELATKLEAMQLAAQDTKDDLIKKLETAQEATNESRQHFENKFKQELKVIQQQVAEQFKYIQEDNKVQQQDIIHKLTQKATADKDVIATLECKLSQKIESYDVISWLKSLEIRALNNQVATVIAVKISDLDTVQECKEYNFRESKLHPTASNTFYIHHRGCRMCLSVSRTHFYDSLYLSVCLYVIKGACDDQSLARRILRRQQFEVKLLNQIGDSEHHIEIGGWNYASSTHLEKLISDPIFRKVPPTSQYHKDDRNPFWTSEKFINDEVLRKVTPTCQYLKDDRVFLEVHFKLD